jgi:hypothetical protein
MQIQLESGKDDFLTLEKLCSDWDIYEKHSKKMRPQQLVRGLKMQLDASC